MVRGDPGRSRFARRVVASLNHTRDPFSKLSILVRFRARDSVFWTSLGLLWRSRRNRPAIRGSLLSWPGSCGAVQQTVFVRHGRVLIRIDTRIGFRLCCAFYLVLWLTFSVQTIVLLLYQWPYRRDPTRAESVLLAAAITLLLFGTALHGLRTSAKLARFSHRWVRADYNGRRKSPRTNKTEKGKKLWSFRTRRGINLASIGARKRDSDGPADALFRAGCASR